MPGGVGSLSEGVAVAALLVLTTVLGMLARQESHGPHRGPLAVAGAAVLILALSFALDALGIQAPVLKLLARLAAFAAICLSLRRLPRWLAALAKSKARMLVEEKLKESDEGFRILVDAIPQLCWMANADGWVFWYNQRWYDYTGTTLEQMEGWGWQSVHDPKVLPQVLEHWRASIDEGKPFEMNVPLLGGDGLFRPFLTRVMPVFGKDGRVTRWFGTNTDITERRAERADLQRQKMESLGLLASGIAHDFNNLLGAMVGHVELFQSELETNGQGKTRLQALEELIDRASKLVAQILAYAGKGRFKVQPLDLNFQVEDMIRLLRASLLRKASIQWQPAPDLPSMEGDQAQIHQVITNLLINASEAVASKGGVITLRTGSQNLVATDIENQFPGQALRPGPYLVFEVSDNGPGMPPEILERIFDPFFTTKFTGRGLGLAVVQGILRSHQGGIQVTTKVGVGTTFKLFFPAVPAPAKAEPVASPGPAIQGTDFQGTGTILVVDDEDALRSVAVAALRRLGFNTLEARDGLEALQVFEAYQDRIRLVLMDLTMPRMGGEEAYREFRRAGSMVPIILSSGFGQEDAFQRFRCRGLAGFLPKPYHFQDLVNTIRDALEGEGGTPIPPGRSTHGEQLVWTRDFETGHPLIDGQHQGLVNAFNHLVAASRRGDRPKELDRAFAHLMDATIAHFGVEEGLMADAAYPNALAHQAAHAQLLRQIRDLAQKVRTGGTTLTPAVIHFLEDWLVCHLQQEDMHLARHLKTGGH